MPQPSAATGIAGQLARAAAAQGLAQGEPDELADALDRAGHAAPLPAAPLAILAELLAYLHCADRGAHDDRA